MYNISKNDPLYKCLLLICLIRASTFKISSRLYNISYTLAIIATFNIINRLIYKIITKNLM
jgi:hypothetical protein